MWLFWHEAKLSLKNEHNKLRQIVQTNVVFIIKLQLEFITFLSGCWSRSLFFHLKTNERPYYKNSINYKILLFVCWNKTRIHISFCKYKTKSIFKYTILFKLNTECIIVTLSSSRSCFKEHNYSYCHFSRRSA